MTERVRKESAEPSSAAGHGAARVAAGIFSSRLAGLVREATLAYFLGAGPHADVFRTALRGPNLLQNLLGQQTLSASFIPVYSRLLEDGREEEAGRFAGAIFGLLLAVAATMALVGVLLARPIVALLATGYLADAAQVAGGAASVDRFPLAVRAVRIIFPMTGILVLSAWCLGVLNSHRRFFLSYFAPVLWNGAIIAALGYAGSRAAGLGALPAGLSRLDWMTLAACFGALVGGGLQFAVQLPLVVRLMRGFRLRISTRVEGVAEALRAFAPLAAGRGVVQLSSYLDLLLASFLAAGAVSALGFALPLYLLPVSLFGMSVAAAELPELARRQAESRSEMAARLDAAFRQMAYLTVPTVVGYLALGFLLVGGLYRRGSFGLEDNWLVYAVLGGYTLGLLASNTSRLLQNVFYAAGRTRVPARIAVERVLLSAALGILLMLGLDRFSVARVVGLPVSESGLRFGAAGLALSAGLAAWYELRRLRSVLAADLPGLRLPVGFTRRLLFASVVSLAPALLVWWLLAGRPVLPQALAVVAVYAVTYFGLTHRMGLSQAKRWLGRLVGLFSSTGRR
ncbi:MAG: murein biosynthesis integral membrane protein MurJ [Thermoanaerobaculia bacterium]